MTDPEFAVAIGAAFQAFNERRFADFATFVTDDVVEVYPQSGERIEGRDRQLAFHVAFPDPPTFTVRNIRRDGNLAVVEVDERSADGTVWKDVWIFELRGGLVASMTGYFGQPFAAPEWRRPYRARPSAAIGSGAPPDAAVDLVNLDPPFNSNRDDTVIFRDESGNATKRRGR